MRPSFTVIFVMQGLYMCRPVFMPGLLAMPTDQRYGACMIYTTMQHSSKMNLLLVYKLPLQLDLVLDEKPGRTSTFSIPLYPCGWDFVYFMCNIECRVRQLSTSSYAFVQQTTCLQL